LFNQGVFNWGDSTNRPIDYLTNPYGGKMKLKHLSAMLMCCILITASHLWAADQMPSRTTQDYIIGPGDVLDISVWNNEALTKTITVLPDGKIHYPLIGEVAAGGRTLAALQKELKDKIKKYVPNPELSVMVNKVNSLLIYVIGKVNSPGRFELNANVNVLQALAIAGGLNPFAKRGKIKIFRETNGKTRILPFDYDDVTDGEHLEQNIMLERGDVVVVP
jgi:polysaccharide export outer membrane protein